MLLPFVCLCVIFSIGSRSEANHRRETNIDSCQLMENIYCFVDTLEYEMKLSEFAHFMTNNGAKSTTFCGFVSHIRSIISGFVSIDTFT